MSEKCLNNEAVEYAESNDYNNLITSKFVGIRSLKMDTKDKGKYNELNILLRELYQELGPNTDYIKIYDYMQRFDQHEQIIGDISNLLEELKSISEENESISDFLVYEDKYWGRIKVYRKNVARLAIDSLIKIYISVKESNEITEVFKAVVEYLMNNCTGMFHAKVTKILRDDQICMWICREDFFQLEEYLKSCSDKLYTPLKFIAYRGKIGISRELYELNSHNGLQAKLISTYFKTIDAVAEIDLLDMYKKYVAAWNGKLPENDIFTKEFKYSNAQEFIILLETLHILIGDGSIDDNHILLSNDAKIWLILKWTKDWGEIGDFIRQYM